MLLGGVLFFKVTYFSVEYNYVQHVQARCDWIYFYLCSVKQVKLVCLAHTLFFKRTLKELIVPKEPEIYKLQYDDLQLKFTIIILVLEQIG